MAKSTKTPAPRKPIKARGALPTPKSGPKRAQKRWYRHQGWQLIAIVAAIAVFGTAWAGGGAWIKNRRETKTNSDAVARFDRSYSVLKSPVVDVLTAIPAKTNEFSAGSLPGPELKKQTEGWLSALRKMDSELRKRKVPPGLPELDQTRAVLVQGYLVYIDGVKVFSLAADATDPGMKEEALKQGNNLLAHAGSIVSTGEALLQRLKSRFDPDTSSRGPAGGESEGQPLQLPAEEAPPAGSGQPGPAGAPADAGAIPGMPPGLGQAPGGVPGAGGIPPAEPPAAP